LILTTTGVAPATYEHRRTVETVPGDTEIRTRTTVEHDDRARASS
jgi:hypothetical protein